MEHVQEIEEEALTPTRRGLYRSASWSVHTNPPPSSSNLNPDSRPSRHSRRALPPLQPLRRPTPALTSWPHLHPDDTCGGIIQPPATPSCRGSDCSRIADHIYLGSDAVARDRDALRRHGITHVLNCVGLPRCPDYFPSELAYKTLHLHDSPAEDITSVLYDAFDFLELVRSLPGARALVHCSKGASRSPSLVIAYLMWSRSHSFSDALSHVRSARSVADPNLGFASQLLQCQRRVHSLPPSPGSSLRFYRLAPHSPYDPLYLVPRALDRPWLPKFDSRGSFLLVHVNLRIFVWLGKFSGQAMAASAHSSAAQIVRYENMKVNVLTVHEGSENGEFWNALTGEDRPPSPPDVGNRRVELYDLDFDIFRRALKGTAAARESGWSSVRKKFMVGGVDGIPEENDEEEEQRRESQFRSPNSLSGDSSITSGDTASTMSTFSPASSSSLDWHNRSPSGSDSNVAQLPLPLQPHVLIAKLPPLHSRKVKTSEDGDKDSSATASLLSLAERRGGNPPSLVLLPPVEGGGSRLSPRDIVRDWCLSPPFISDAEEHMVGMDTDKPTSSGRKVDDDEDEEMSNMSSDGNDCVWQNKPALFRWPSMEKIEEISPGVLDSKSVFMLLVPANSSPGKAEAMASVVYVWVGRHSQLSRHSDSAGICETHKDDMQIDLGRIRVSLIDRMALPLDVPVQIIREDEEPEQFLSHLFSSHQQKESMCS